MPASEYVDPVTRPQAILGGRRGRLGVGGLGAAELSILPVALAAAVLGFMNLGAKSVWVDEAISVGMARLDAGTLLATLPGNDAGNMSLYYVTLKAWLRVFGDGDLALRSLSVVAVTVGCVVVFALGRRLFGTTAGAAAALFFAVHPFIVEYAQEGRAYALAALMATASTYVFVRAIDERRRAWWLAYGLVAGIAMYAHFFVGFVLAAHWIVGAGARLLTRPAALGLGVAGVVAAPLAIMVLSKTSRVAWIDAPTLESAISAFGRATGGPVLATVSIVGAAILIVRTPRPGRWRVLLVTAWLVAPIVGSLLVSLVKPLLVDRYLIVATPAVAILCGALVARLPWRGVRAAAAVAVLAVSLSGVVAWYAAPAREEWGAVAGSIRARAERGDALLVIDPGVWPGLAYHLPRGLPVDPVYPAAEWGRANLLKYRIGDLTDGSLGADLAGANRVWLVLSHTWNQGGHMPAVGQALAGIAAADFRAIEDRDAAPGIRVILFDRVRPTP